MKPPTKSGPTIIRGVVRRTVLKQMAALGLAAGSGFGAWLAASAGPLAAVPRSDGDYKALICLFQWGGNDHANMVVPLGAGEYRRYATERGDKALPRDSLLPLNGEGLPTSLGLHPALVRAQGMFNAREAALMANVGPLEVPTSQADYRNKRVPLPRQLFSHSDQQRAWHSGYPIQKVGTGWLGRLGDQIAPLFNAGALGHAVMGAAGPSLMTMGQDAQQFSLPDPRNRNSRIIGTSRLFASRENAEAVRRILTASNGSLFQQQLAHSNSDAIRQTEIFNRAAQPFFDDASDFPDTKIGRQLQRIYFAIKAAPVLKQQRQVFLAGHGGWDFHANLLLGQNELLTAWDEAIGVLRDKLVADGLWDKVVIFTAGDFGRTLVSNGQGSDHGWGGHHLVFGGPVRGGRIVGTLPELARGTIDDAGQGRLIPTTATSQYAADLLAWFGLDQEACLTVMPNLAAFDRAALGLFKTA